MDLGGYGAIYNCLTEIGRDGSPVAELAESFEAEPGAARWVFRIREGVTFSDGRTFRPEAVVASISHHRGAESNSAAKPIISDIRVDGQNVVVDLDQGNADFAYLMSDHHLVIGPSDEGKVDWDAHTGTGSCVLESYAIGTRMLLARPGLLEGGARLVR